MAIYFSLGIQRVVITPTPTPISTELVTCTWVLKMMVQFHCVRGEFCLPHTVALASVPVLLQGKVCLQPVSSSLELSYAEPNVVSQFFLAESGLAGGAVGSDIAAGREAANVHWAVKSRLGTRKPGLLFMWLFAVTFWV